MGSSVGVHWAANQRALGSIPTISQDALSLMLDSDFDRHSPHCCVGFLSIALGNDFSRNILKLSHPSVHSTVAFLYVRH